MIVSLWVIIFRHAIQNRRFTISFQYVKKNVKDELDLFTADKRGRFLQNFIIILDVCGQACPYCPKYQVCYFSLTS